MEEEEDRDGETFECLNLLVLYLFTTLAYCSLFYHNWYSIVLFVWIEYDSFANFVLHDWGVVTWWPFTYLQLT